MLRTDYENGLAFGRAYARTHGVHSLLKVIRQDVGDLDHKTHPMPQDYVAGEVDAALKEAQS